MTNVTHNSFLCIYFIFNSLHVSSTSCWSSGETNCVNTHDTTTDTVTKLFLYRTSGDTGNVAVGSQTKSTIKWYFYSNNIYLWTRAFAEKRGEESRVDSLAPELHCFMCWVKITTLAMLLWYTPRTTAVLFIKWRHYRLCGSPRVICFRIWPVDRIVGIYFCSLSKSAVEDDRLQIHCIV